MPDTPQLPVDLRVDALLSEIAREPDDPDARHKAFALRAAQADLHMAGGIGRRLLRTHARIAELRETLDKFEAEVVEVAAPLEREARDLTEMLDAMALIRRDAGLGLTMDVPGVGRWSTRAPAARWAVNNDEVIAGLAGDIRAAFVERVPPAPPAERVRGTDLRKHLDDLLADATTTIDADQAAIEGAGGQPLPPGLRERLILDAAERIAAAYPGVTYVAGEITVSHRLNEAKP